MFLGELAQAGDCSAPGPEWSHSISKAGPEVGFSSRFRLPDACGPVQFVFNRCVVSLCAEFDPQEEFHLFAKSDVKVTIFQANHEKTLEFSNDILGNVGLLRKPSKTRSIFCFKWEKKARAARSGPCSSFSSAPCGKG